MGVGAYTGGQSRERGWDILALRQRVRYGDFEPSDRLPALRLRGLYFGVATFGGTVHRRYLVQDIEPITHGVFRLADSAAEGAGHRHSDPNVCDGMRSISVVCVVGDVPVRIPT